MKYIPADKLIAEIERRIEETKSMKPAFDQFWAGQISAFKGAIKITESLQQEQPIEGKQVIIITETNGDANIHWDCRSLDDVNALLASAQSFIADKQIEELRGQGSGPDYNTTEGRFRNAYKFQQEQSEGLHFTPLNRLIMKIPSKNWNDTVNNYAKKLRDCLIKEGYLKDASVLQGYISYMNGNNVPIATMDEQEQPEVDLDGEIKKMLNSDYYKRHIKPSPYVIDVINYTARHFYELGKARKV